MWIIQHVKHELVHILPILMEQSVIIATTQTQDTAHNKIGLIFISFQIDSDNLL
uniref:Uncharacterized protein n=1 Tax=Lepeophtheirus salmonis TaxID=72036 RepID=A0A0K2T7J3_LEPSM